MDDKNIWEQNLEKLKKEVLQNPYWKIKVKKSEKIVKTVLQNQIKTLLLEIVDVSERFEVFFSSADYKIIEIGRLKSNYINLLHFFDAIENGNIEIVDGFAFYIQYKYFIDNENVKIIESDQLWFYFNSFQFSVVATKSTYSKFYDENFSKKELEKIVNQFAENLLEKVNTFIDGKYE